MYLGSSISLDTPINSLFYSGGVADKQEAVNCKISSTKCDLKLYVPLYLFFSLQFKTVYEEKLIISSRRMLYFSFTFFIIHTSLLHSVGIRTSFRQACPRVTKNSSCHVNFQVLVTSPHHSADAGVHSLPRGEPSSVQLQRPTFNGFPSYSKNSPLISIIYT